MRVEQVKKILLCVAGGTPQIITETLWALIQERGERVDEIRVITTLEGRRKIRDKLLDSGKFEQFRNDFPQAEGIKFDENCLYILTNKETGVPSPRDDDEDRLEDIRTKEDNDRAANQICEIVSELTQNSKNVIHATVAGGRKTMSIYLTVAMQLFGRASDCISHVLVSPEVENHPDFFYKPPTPITLNTRHGEMSTDLVRIELVEIPFVRLCGVDPKLLRSGSKRYGELVEGAQISLHLTETDATLSLDLNKRTISLATSKGGLKTKLQGRFFYIYLMFALRRKHDPGDGTLSYDDISDRQLDEAFQLITGKKYRPISISDYQRSLDQRADEPMTRDRSLRDLHKSVMTLMRQKAGKAYDEIEAYKKNLDQTITKTNRQLANGGFPEKYRISRSGGYGAARYGIDIDPHYIELL